MMRRTGTYVTLILALIFASVPAPLFATAASVPPTILSYQGRLTDSGGNLLGGSGTTYYFKFSIWDNATVGAGNRVWPPAGPTATTASVRQGTFEVDIGDTTNGYPDPLTLNFANYSQLYLQVEVSSDNVTYETLSPRQQLTSTVYAQVAGAVVGTTTPSMLGTTTAASNSFVTIAATSSNTTPLSIVGALSQSANLFQVLNNSLQNVFAINSSGAVSLTSLTASAGASLQAATSTSLAVTGSTTISGQFNAVNGATFGAATIAALTGAAATFTSATTSAFAINGSSTISSLLNIGGLLNANGGIATIGATSSALAVNGSSTVSAILNVGGSLKANGGLSVQGTASTTNLIVSALGPSSGQCLTVNSSGSVSTTACGAGSTFPFSPLLDYGANTSATTTPLWAQNGIFASSTSHFVAADFSAGATSSALAVTGSTTVSGISTIGGLLNANGGLTLSGTQNSILATNGSTVGALGIGNGLTFSGNILQTSFGTTTQNFFTNYNNFRNLFATNASSTYATTTNLALTSVTSSLLKTNALGQLVAAVAGTDYQVAGNYATFGYLFPANATSSLLAFNGGLTANGATTTALAVTGSTTIASNLNVGGISFFAGNVGVGTTSPSATLAINGGLFTTASSTLMNGISLAGGCFSVGGTCISNAAGTNVVLTAVRTGTATSTWTVPSNLVYAVVELWGAGGGGGGGGSSGSTGGTGGDTNFGGLATSTGGSGGGGGGTASSGGQGGLSIPLGGDVELDGNNGGPGGATAASGQGGTAPRGGGGGASVGSSIAVGFSGADYGGGGSGGGNTTASRTGAGGGSGSFLQKTFTAALLAGTTSVQIGVGSGGSAGAGGGTGAINGGKGGNGGYVIYEYTAANVNTGNGSIASGSTGQVAVYSGNGTSVAGTASLYIDPVTGNVGVSSQSPPAAKLTVQANTGDANTSLFSIASSTASSNTTLFSVFNTGTASTTSLVISTLGSSAGQCLTVDSTGLVNASSCGSGAVYPFTPSIDYAVTSSATSTPLWAQSGLFASSTSHFVTADFSGNVGIGSTSPALPLSVSGSAYIGNGASANLTFDAANITFPQATKLILQNGSNGALSIATSSSNVPVFSISTRSSPVGLVGVGTSTPWGKFSIEMGTYNPSFSVSNTGSSTPSLIVTGVNQNGAVGIASTTPSVLNALSVSGSTYLGNGSNSTLTIDSDINFPSISTTTIKLAPNGWAIATTSSVAAGVQPIINISSLGGATTTIGFFVATTTALTAGSGLALPASLQNYLIVGNGKVQAGMAIVRGGLCVDSDGWCTASTTGRISAVTSTVGSTDVAEVYTSTSTLLAGTIVATDGMFAVKAAANDTVHHAIGIVSTAPGLTLGLQPGEDFGGQQYPIALVGRVPVLVNLDNGPIAIGDRIALSTTTPGMGMKAGVFDSSVGIALEDFASTTATSTSIMVFVNLSDGTNADTVGAGLLNALASTTSAFTSSFFSSITDHLKQWFADATNGITKFFAGEVHTNELCVKKSDGTEVCVTGDQLAALLATTGTTSAPPTSSSTTTSSTNTTTATSTQTATTASSTTP